MPEKLAYQVQHRVDNHLENGPPAVIIKRTLARILLRAAVHQLLSVHLNLGKIGITHKAPRL